jgi:metal-dependent amidase/aminoacylase/carboxypeptidase family protein
MQSIISREIRTGETAVITVGYVQAGTKNNIIPDQAQMGLTVRPYKPEVREHLVAAIERIAKGEAEASDQHVDAGNQFLGGASGARVYLLTNRSNGQIDHTCGLRH